MKIINVMAMSLDGKIAMQDDESDASRRQYGFTNDDDRDFVRQQLIQADAVVTGAKSLRASGGAWQVKNKHGRFPAWIVLTSRGLEKDLKFWQQTTTERWLVSQAPVSTGVPPSEVRNVVYGDEEPASFLYRELVRAKFQTVLLFGGGEINRLFYAAGLVDELRLTICPIILGTPHASAFVLPPLPSPCKFHLESSHPNGNLVFLKYTVQKS